MFEDAPYVLAAEQAREIHATTGFLPALNDPRLDLVEVATWEPWEGEEELDRLLELLESDDPVDRSVVGATLYFLMLNEHDSAARATLTHAMERFTNHLPVMDIRTLKQWQWELHVAAANEHLDRILALGRRLEDLHGQSEHRALLVRAAFNVAHPSHLELDPSSVDPLIHAPGWDLEPVFDAMTHVLSTVVEKQPDLKWSDPDTFPPEVLNALADIDVHIRKLENEACDLTPTQRGIQCWCKFALAAAARDAAELTAAGQLFSKLPSPSGLAEVDWRKWRAACRCFALALNWAEAENAAHRWADVRPGDADAHHRLAQACYKQNKIPEAIEAYETFVRLKEESTDEWEPNLLLRLGLENQDRHSLAHALESAAFSAQFRPSGERLTAWFMPWFPSLSREARERWWVGIFDVASPHVADEIGDARWGQAADCFGETVALELKARVFGPFSQSFKAPGPDEHWKAVLRGRGTLGRLLQCLLQAQTGDSGPGRELQRWLQANTPAFAGHVSMMRRTDVQPLWELRGEAQHATVGEAEARRVYELAAALLRALTSD